MRKVWIGIVALMLALVLTACSNEKDEIEGVNNDFGNLVDGAEVELDKAQQLVENYANQVMSGEEYEVEKEKMFSYFDGLKKDLDKIEEPKSDRAKEYYNKSYDVVDIMISLSKDVMEVPDMTDFSALEEYQANLLTNLESLEKAIDKVTDLEEKLIGEDEEYQEIFEDH